MLPVGTPTEVVALDDVSEPVESTPRTSSRIGVLVALVVLALLVAPLLLGDETVVPGSQRSRGAIKYRGLEGGNWAELLSAAGSAPTDEAAPMVRHEAEICVGFGEGPPEERVPSLARCVAPAAGGPMLAGELMVVSTLPAGTDVWHFIEAAAPVDRLRVELETGRLSDDRIYSAGTSFALRLPVGVGVETLEWRAERVRYRCESDTDAWASAAFCVAP